MYTKKSKKKQDPEEIGEPMDNPGEEMGEPIHQLMHRKVTSPASGGAVIGKRRKIAKTGFKFTG